jgi:hypothetical protein
MRSRRQSTAPERQLRIDTPAQSPGIHPTQSRVRSSSPSRQFVFSARSLACRAVRFSNSGPSPPRQQFVFSTPRRARPSVLQLPRLPACASLFFNSRASPHPPDVLQPRTSPHPPDVLQPRASPRPPDVLQPRRLAAPTRRSSTPRLATSAREFFNPARLAAATLSFLDPANCRLRPVVLQLRSCRVKPFNSVPRRTESTFVAGRTSPAKNVPSTHGRTRADSGGSRFQNISSVPLFFHIAKENKI